jgi:hypothetical protein
MQLIFNQNPHLFFVVLLVIMAFMLVYILLQHSKISGLIVLLSSQSDTMDQTGSRLLSDDLALESISAEQGDVVVSRITSIQVNDPTGKYGGYKQDYRDSIDHNDMHHIPNPATFNAHIESASGGGQS